MSTEATTATAVSMNRLASISRQMVSSTAKSMQQQQTAHAHTAAAAATQSFKDTDAVILSACRTPIGALQGSLASVTATQLSAITIKEAVRRAKIPASDVNEVILGHVVSANSGQAPSTQASAAAGLPFTTPTTSINKVCSSGLKAIMFAAQSIELSQNTVVVAGGMESMSNTPFYLPSLRKGHSLGHTDIIDGIIRDGLWDATDNQHMGSCAEKCAVDYSISRAEQDAYCLQSYARAQAAQQQGLFAAEIVGVPVKARNGVVAVVVVDDEPQRLLKDKVPTLKPAFKKEAGTVTAANSSKLNDGAATVVLASGAYARKHQLQPLAVIRGYADAQQAPVDFTTTPAIAIPLALKRAGVAAADVDLYEINEAFSVVAIANQRLLQLQPQQLNVWGGAVALGHPIGCSGARILVTLLHQLQALDKRIGVVGICNGGGGASAMVVERLV